MADEDTMQGLAEQVTDENLEEETTADKTAITETPEKADIVEEKPEKEETSDDKASKEKETETPTFDALAEIDKLKIDDTVKKQLKAGYLRQADYTRKTQEIAETKKLAEEYGQFRPYIDKVLQNPELYKQVFGEDQDKKDQTPEYPDDPVEYAKVVKEQAKSELKAELEQERLVNQDLHEAEGLDPRLNNDTDFQKAIAGYVAQDSEFLAGKKTATQATKEGIAQYEAYTAKLRSSFKQDLSNRAKNRKMVIPQGGSPLSTKGEAPQTMAEAAVLAEEEMAG